VNGVWARNWKQAVAFCCVLHWPGKSEEAIAIPLHTTVALGGGYSSYSSTSVLDGSECSASRPGCL
jgi:hypothetical protein